MYSPAIFYFFFSDASSFPSSSSCFSFFQIIWSNVKSRSPSNNKYLNKSREVISLNQKEKYEQVESVHNGKNRWSTYRMCYAVRVLGSRFVCALFCSTSAKNKRQRKENGMYENKNNRQKKSCNEPVRMRANQMYNSNTITILFYIF